MGDISIIVKRLRDSRGLSQDRLSVLSGVNQSIISRLERGKKPRFELDTLVKLADFFDVSLDQLTGRQPLPTPAPVTRLLRAFREAEAEDPAAAEAIVQAVERGVLDDAEGFAALLENLQKWRRAGAKSGEA